jgi:hypothetical protein
VSPTQALPVASALIIFLFAFLVFQRYRRRGGAHLLVWGIGLTMFGVGSLAEAYSTLGWHPTVFRLWYLGGAVLNAAWLGQGTVYLLSGQRLPHLLVSLIFGYTSAGILFLTLGTVLGWGRGAEAALIAFHGAIFAAAFHRRLVRRWPAARLVSLLTGLLVAGSLVATYLVFTVPLNAARFNPQETLSFQYRDRLQPDGSVVPGIMPRGAAVRRLTPIFNIYGLLTLVGGALYSAFLLWRREIAPHRVIGNILIAGGALSLGLASIWVRLGLGDYLYVGELAGAVLMFAGFLLATARVQAAAPRVVEQVGSGA